MGIREDFQAQTGADGLVRPLNDPSSRNGLRFFAQKHIYYVLLGISRLPDLEDFCSVVKGCEIEPGLYQRAPHDPMQITIDDMIPVALASKLLKTGHAKEMAEYGRRTGYVYNSEDPGKLSGSAWYDRMPQFIAHLMFCAGEMPPLLDRLYWCAVILLSAFTKRDYQDGQFFSLMLIMAARGRCFLCDFASEIWLWRFKADWPGGLKQVMTAYFGGRWDDALALHAPEVRA